MVSETIRIIIVDDHDLVRSTWKMVLNETDSLEVIAEFSSGLEAIELAPSLDPDIVLMDINMTPVNGFEATRKILKTNPRIRIIGLSINNQPGYARNIIQLGAKGYLTKNCTREEMILAIKEVMDGKTYICQEVLSKMT